MAGRALKIDPKDTTATEPNVQPGRIEESAIAARAYECWQERGCPIGSDQEDWFRAEEELQQKVGSVPEAARRIWHDLASPSDKPEPHAL